MNGQYDNALLIQPASSPVQQEFEDAYEHAPECVKVDKRVAEFFYRKGRLAGMDAEMKSRRDEVFEPVVIEKEM